MLKIIVVSVLAALIHSSASVLVELDSTDFGASPCGWTLQNFEQLGSVEAAEQYRIQSTGDENRYLVLTETEGQTNKEYDLKQSAEIELRFKYYQSGGTLKLLYLEADNSVPVHVAYSHDGEEDSKGWRNGEAHISRSATEQPFTILFEATTKDPKEDPVALDSLTILFEDVGAYKRSLTYDNPREESLQEQQDTIKKLEASRNIENYNTGINNKEVKEHSYVESKDNYQKLEEKFHKIPFDRLKKESLKISENRNPKKRDFILNKKAEHYPESNKVHLSENTRGGLISRKKIIPESIEGLTDNQKYESKEKGSLSGSLKLIKSKSIEKENINNDKQRRQADDTEGSDDSNDDPTNESEENEETSESGDNEANAPDASEATSESDDNEPEATETNEENPDDEDNPKESSATDEETPTTDADPTDAPETDEKTPAPESNPTETPETNKETSPPETEENPTKATDTQDNPKNATTSPEDNTEPPIGNQESQEDNNSTQTETPPDVTDPPNVNTTPKPESETTNKTVTASPVPPADKETTQAPVISSPKPTDPIPLATEAPSIPPRTTAVITPKPDTNTNKPGSSDEDEGSINEPGNTHLWYIPVVLVAFVVCGVVLFRYLQLKKRRGGYARAGSSSGRGGDYTNPTFSRDAGDEGRVYDGGGRSYDSTRTASLRFTLMNGAVQDGPQPILEFVQLKTPEAFQTPKKNIFFLNETDLSLSLKKDA